MASKKVKALDLNGTLLEPRARDMVYKPCPNTDKLKEKKSQKKSPSLRSGQSSLRSDISARDKSKPTKKLSWAGAPQISFNMGPKQRAAILRVLENPPSDPKRQQYEHKLEVEFARIYTRARRRIQPTFNLPPKSPERKHARKAGILCIEHGITPGQLIEYWAGRVGQFTSMRFPTLRFLAGPGQFDEVVSSSLGKSAGSGDVAGHTFTNSDGLDGRIRPALTERGFDLSEYNDRALLTIQAAARARLGGSRMFVSGKMLPMVKAVMGLLGED